MDARETTQQLSWWKSPLSVHPKPPPQEGVTGHIHSIVCCKFVPQRQTVNEHCRIDASWHLQENVRQNFPEKWNLGCWFLDHENVRAYFAFSVSEFLVKNNCRSTPSLLTRFSTMCLLSFPKSQVALKGVRFMDISMFKQSYSMHSPSLKQCM